MESIKLNNGLDMPIIGSGTNTYGKEGNEYSGALRGDTEEIDWAIENGYRHFDSAQLYQNEEVVGKGLAKSSVPREDFFITTKLNTMDGYKGAEWAHAEIEKSFEKLQTDYFDQFLIHFPWDNEDEILEAWGILEDYYERGVFKSIGVSNFEKQHLDIILEKGKIKPMANQIKSNAGDWAHDLVEYNNQTGLVTVAWGPLGGIEGEAEKVLTEIGEQYGKTAEQVVLRYQIDRDVVVIPKSHNKDRQAQSLNLFDFELTAEDRARIAKL